MTRSLLAVLLLSLASTAPGKSAAQADPPLQLGQRIRIHPTAAFQRSPIVGTLESLEPTGLVVQREGTDTTRIAVPFVVIERLAVSQGALSSGARAREGLRGSLLMGAALSGISLVASWYLYHDDPWRRALPWMGAGMAAGYVVGSRQTEVWRPRPVPRMRVEP